MGIAHYDNLDLEPLPGNSNDMNPERSDPGPTKALIAPTQRDPESAVFQEPSTQSAI